MFGICEDATHHSVSDLFWVTVVFAWNVIFVFINVTIRDYFRHDNHSFDWDVHVPGHFFWTTPEISAFWIYIF